MAAKRLKHKFQSEQVDSTDTNLVRPSNWNDDHDFFLGVNAQTGTSYTFVDGDVWTLVTFSNAAAVAVSLPQAGAAGKFPQGWKCYVRNKGAGAVTITPSGSTIDGAAALVLTTNQSAVIISDGANYSTVGNTPPAVTAAQITDASANGRSLIKAADYAAMRTLLSLRPGTDVQAYEADLAAIAALTTTAYGRSLLEASNAAALRSLAGTIIGTDVQAFDADLSAIAALSTTTYGRSLLTQNDAAALRTTAGLVIGTNVQAYDSDLASIAALSTTTYGRAFLTLADAAALRSLTSAREVLTANRTYYVRSDGNDSNDGLANTSARAFASIQKAIDVAAALDSSIYGVTIISNTGSSSTIFLKPLLGTGTLTIAGDETTQSNCLINPAGYAFYGGPLAKGGDYLIAGFKIQSGSAADIVCSAGVHIVARNIEYAGTANYRIYCGSGGQFETAGANNKISGGGISFFQVDQGGTINFSNSTFTVTTNVTFSQAFASARWLGVATSTTVTFTLGGNTVTGSRYNVQTNAVMATSLPGGANHFPGNSVGTTATGGQYS